MSGHTQEPWEAVTDCPGKCCWIIRRVGADGPMDRITFPEMSEADARRIVACVNACKGLTTEGLEQCLADGDTVLRRLEQWQIDCMKMEQQRDNLLAALKDIASRHRHRGTLTLDVEEFIDIENLIAEIEESQ